MKPNWLKAALFACLTLAGAGAQAGVILTDSTYRLFDRSAGGVQFNVTGHGAISDINLTIDFSKCDNPPIGPDGRECIGTGLAFPNEIEFRLIGPEGYGAVDLVRLGTYTSGSGRVTVSFDDEAAAQVGGQLAGGSYRPVEALSAFDGRDMFGTWTLFIRDAGAGDPLEYFSSTLEIIGGSEPEPVPVSEPGMAGMLGIGLLGMCAVRRRRK